MNFEKFKEQTDLRIKKGLEDEDNGLPIVMAMERCEAIKEFLDEAYTSILSEGERAYIEDTIKAGRKRMIRDVLQTAMKSPDAFKELMNGLFGKGDSEEGDF